MKQRSLGKNGPLVGEVGFGAMSFASWFGPTDEAASHRALDKALEVGSTHVDTALVYGPYVSEEFIGSYLAKNPTAKEKISIGTKGGIQANPRAIINEKQFMRECLEGSLKRLGVEHVDLYYIHRRDQSIPIEEVMETLAEFKTEGKIGGIGFSEISPASLERAVKVHPVRAVQSEFSLWSRIPLIGMLQATKRHGAALVAYSPVARGMLSDTNLDPASFASHDFRKANPRFQPEFFASNQRKIEEFKTYAKKRGWFPSALALAWVLHQGNHVIPIPGTRSAEHVAQNATASEISLSAQDLAEIDAILPPGWAHGHRYSDEQQKGVEQYC